MNVLSLALALTVWTPPAIASDQYEATPTFTPDGKRLYFISMRQDPAKDDFDIWYVEQAREDAWSEPRRLPEPVNSTGAELLPRADRDWKLYFGSDRAGGFGQGDIYVATQGAATRLLFAQAHGARSGELFLIDLAERPDGRWPACNPAVPSRVHIPRR